MTSFGNRPLRQWQIDAYNRWRENGRRGIVAVVTGAGKTIFALHCLRDYRNTVPAATALIVVPTEVLLDQWVEEATSFFGIPFGDIVVLNGKRKLSLSRIHVGVINTVAQMAARPPDFPVFMIVDECHRAASPVFQQVFRIKSEASLGLSATPERPYDDGMEEILVPNIGKVIFNYTYRDALRDEVIVPFSLHNVVFSFAPEEQARYDRLTKAIHAAASKYGLESPETVSVLLKRSRLSNASPDRVRVALTIVSKHKQERVLIFHEDIAACEVIHKALDHFNVAAGICHSRMSFKKRIETLLDYRAGKIRVLVSCRALDEGFNVPETEVGIIAASTATHRQRVQRLGRILRPFPGKKRATVYSIVAAQAEVRRLAEEATTLEGVADVTWSRA
jgi:superfamily II DNA or RNA helicase